MKNKIFKKGVMLFLLTLTIFLNAKNYNPSSEVFNVFETKDFIQSKVETKTFFNEKYGVTYDISFGSDNFGNITSVNIKFATENMTKLQKEVFIQKYKNMLQKFTKLSKDNKKLLIYPEESCISGCISGWQCSDKPTNAGVALCTGDCIEECYL
ncbi:hypothetical protein [Frigoriflavimonas asaccharolytica]|uniref:Uncharacterized protein n=1 Tax=Frigoriflavimonas asaccharolytica TaxID=2735899 RepID=A0A8J8GAF9_9FLAO|nr:hypothetical protein [Frigoriflavimonas asaccharolytica]NRS93906.1 hypothetical protein [Frigoriflavimonas asaccharolytica]